MDTRDFMILMVLIGIFGGVIGAYYGTIEYRIRNGLRLVTAKCYCPLCGHELSLLQQFPIMGWVALRGRCKYCRQPISIRYPLSEGMFIFFYILIFILMHHAPLMLVLTWFLFTALLLALRCQGYRGLIKGLGIMFFYHLLFGSVVILLLHIL